MKNLKGFQKERLAAARSPAASALTSAVTPTSPAPIPAFAPPPSVPSVAPSLPTLVLLDLVNKHRAAGGKLQ